MQYAMSMLIWLRYGYYIIQQLAILKIYLYICRRLEPQSHPNAGVALAVFTRMKNLAYQVLNCGLSKVNYALYQLSLRKASSCFLSFSCWACILASFPLGSILSAIRRMSLQAPQSLKKRIILRIAHIRPRIRPRTGRMISICKLFMNLCANVKKKVYIQSKYVI